MSVRTTKVLVDYTLETDSELLTKTDLIIEGMTGNANFPTPIPTVTALQTARDNYNTSLVAAGSGNHNSVAVKNADRSVLETALCTLGNYINTVARGNLVAIISTNMPYSKNAEPGNLGTVESMKLTPGQNSGTLFCKLSRVKNGKSYTFMITEDPISNDSLWSSYVTTRCSYEFTKLTPGTKYWVKVIVAGTRGQSVQSGPICQFPLL